MKKIKKINLKKNLFEPSINGIKKIFSKAFKVVPKIN